MLIGMKISVADISLSGRVVDETKNTLVISSENGLKTVVKAGKKILIYMDGKKIKIRGDEIRFRPWEYAVQ